MNGVEELFQYQKEGVEWLVGKRHALLADQMGLGKTAQAIVAADCIQASPILVLCPAIARANWLNEFARFSSRTLSTLSLTTAAQPKPTPSPDVVVCSYDLARQTSVFSWLSATAWSLLVLDEAHFLKGIGAARAKYVLGSNGLIHKAKRCWALTGTPAPNHPGEVWTLLYVFGGTKLDQEAFTARYCKLRHTPYGPQVTGGQNLAELKDVLRPFMLRRRKQDVLKDLPAITFSEHIVAGTKLTDDDILAFFPELLTWRDKTKGWEQLHDKIREASDTMAKALGQHGVASPRAYEVLCAMQEAPNVTRMRRMAGVLKAKTVADIVAEELRASMYEKIVLFGVHKQPLEELEYHLREFGAVRVYGGTEQRRRDKHVRRFQTDPACRVFVGQTVAAGTAITLTAASEIGIVEADWTPANNQQAIMRVHRIGQTKPVRVRWFGLENSIDQPIMRILKQKTRTLVQLFDE